jgi:hypothetical protein
MLMLRMAFIFNGFEKFSVARHTANIFRRAGSGIVKEKAPIPDSIG